MLRFHASIHARPPGEFATTDFQYCGLRYAALAIRPDLLGAPLLVSFEQALDHLAALSRLFIEPDGSFVWRGVQPDWQLDGELFDLAERLLYVKVKGECPSAAFDQLLAALGGAQQPFVFQLVQQGVFLDQDEFRRFAEHF